MTILAYVTAAGGGYICYWRDWTADWIQKVFSTAVMINKAQKFNIFFALLIPFSTQSIVVYTCLLRFSDPSVPPPILASSFVIILALTSLSLAYCTEDTFAIHFATEAIYCIAHKATWGAYGRLLCLITVNASTTIMSPPAAAAAAAAVMTITVID